MTEQEQQVAATRLIDYERMKRRVAYMEQELAHTKDWANQYKAEVTSLRAKIASLLAKYTEEASHV